jgi:hypothetical protein
MGDARVCDGEEVRTLPAALRVILSRTGPRLIVASAALAWGARLALGRPAVSDAVICAGVAAWWPLQEWLAHKHLLHLAPDPSRPLVGDPLFARRHRAHHRDPRDVDNTLLPVAVIAVAIPVNALLWAAAFRSARPALTGIAAYSTMAALYEWTHFLVHTGVKPASAFYHRVRRNHRLHHYRNENYWLGFTLPWVDKWLGTEPDPRSVPHSKTARDLFGDAAARGHDG